MLYDYGDKSGVDAHTLIKTGLYHGEIANTPYSGSGVEILLMVLRSGNVVYQRIMVMSGTYSFYERHCRSTNGGISFGGWTDDHEGE